MYVFFKDFLAFYKNNCLYLPFKLIKKDFFEGFNELQILEKSILSFLEVPYIGWS